MLARPDPPPPAGRDDYRERRDGVSRSPPRLKTAAAFCNEYQPLAYVIEPLMRTSSIYALTARTGGGKTAFCVAAVLAVASGRRDILGLEVEQGRVAYLAFENPDDVRMRLIVAAHHLQVDLDRLARDLLILDARHPPEAIFDSLRFAASQGDLRLIVLDTFAAGFDGRDINDNVQAGEFVRRLRPLTSLPGSPAVLIAAHPTKNAADDNLVPYGGGAILNEVDGNLTLARRADNGNTVLHWQGKFRGLEFTPLNFQFDTVTAPAVVDRKGREVPLPVLRPCAGGDSDADAEREIDVDVAILRCLADDPVPTIREIAERVGRGKSAVAAKLARLGREKLVDKILDKWVISAKGRKAL